MEEEIAPGVGVIYGSGICSNVYVIRSGGKTVLVDSGDGSLDLDLEPDAVLLTHGHMDHTLGVKKGWKSFLAKEDFGVGEFLKAPEGAEGMDFNEYEVGEFVLDIIRTPGHTMGSVCFLEREKGILFSGDTLFANGDIGRTDLGGNFKLMVGSLKSISNLHFRLLCPGHGQIERRGEI